MVAASVDSDAETDFVVADTVRMEVAAPGENRAPRIVSELAGLSDERALVFGEIYPRGAEWKVRAVGQGYADGLHALVTEYGVEVDDAVPTEEEAGDSKAARSLQEPEQAEQPPRASEKSLALTRRRKQVVKIPGDWKKRVHPGIPVPTSAEPWRRARLFPTVGIRSSAEQEGRTTSVLLSVMSAVPESGRRIADLLGAPRGRLETFTKIAFALAGHDYRPDGLLRITRGSRVWIALVEVKTAKGKLGTDQVEGYIQVAKSKEYDAVVTISCDLTAGVNDLPYRFETRPPKSVRVFHLSWESIVTEASLQRAADMSDRSQQRLMEEFLLYAADPQSGMWPFGDMGRHRVKVRDGIADGTLSAADTARSVLDSISS